MARRPSGDDPYVYPGTLTLKNRFGLHDPALLRVAEYAATRRRAMDAPAFPLTPEGFKATHRHLFQDVLPWAGQVRTVGLTHPRHDDPFAFPHLIEGALAKQFRWLAAEGNLAGLDRAAFAAKAAYHTGELNAVHAFRDGNGRSMRLHLEQLAAQAGHRLDVSRLPAQEWNDASRVSFLAGDSRPLAAVIERALEPPRALPDPERQATATLSGDGRLVYAALAEKIDRQMGKLTAEGKADMRRFVAEELARREAKEGPVALSAEARRLATAPQPEPAPAPKPEPKSEGTERNPPTPPDPPRRRR